MGESDSKENYCKDIGSERVLVTRGAVVDLEIFLQGGGGGGVFKLQKHLFFNSTLEHK